MLTVTTPATSFQLTTPERLQEEHPEIPESRAEHLIDEASSAIASFLNRVLARQSYTETVKGYGDRYLTLTASPIETLTGVTQSSSTVTDVLIDDAEAGILYRELGFEWTRGQGWQLASFPIPYSEVPEFSVDYVAGWALPHEDDRNLPPVLERACMDLAAGIQQRAAQDQTVQSVRLGDFATTYREPAPAAVAVASGVSLPPQIANSIQRFMRGVGTRG